MRSEKLTHSASCCPCDECRYLRVAPTAIEAGEWKTDGPRNLYELKTLKYTVTDWAFFNGPCDLLDFINVFLANLATYSFRVVNDKII